MATDNPQDQRPSWDKRFGLLLVLMLLLAGCRQRPSPPSRNLFYEVKTLSVTTPADDPVPATVSNQELNLDVANRDLIPRDFQASWEVDWECTSENCQTELCTGTGLAAVRGVVEDRWLEVDRRIEWDGECGQRASWLSQIDRYTGQERYPSKDDVLFNFWAGAHPGPANDVVHLSDGQSVSVWCSGPRQAEVEEGDGWTTLYDGEVCYDTQTGILVYMNYMKRWVFTGTFQGQEYTRAYFGDSETYEQRLKTTNAKLDFVPR